MAYQLEGQLLEVCRARQFVRVGGLRYLKRVNARRRPFNDRSLT